jgi:hypothetical protein
MAAGHTPNDAAVIILGIIADCLKAENGDGEPGAVHPRITCYVSSAVALHTKRLIDSLKADVQDVAFFWTDQQGLPWVVDEAPVGGVWLECQGLEVQLTTLLHVLGAIEGLDTTDILRDSWQCKRPEVCEITV